jgi:hypothetical protein
LKRFAVIGTALCLTAHVASAQTQSDTVAKPASPPVGAWAGLTLGPATATNRPITLIGAQLAGYLSLGNWMVGYRRAIASGIETTGAHDEAFLVGARVRSPFTTGFVAVGLSSVANETTKREGIGLGFSAEAGGNLRVVGLGASVFGAVAPHVSFIGIGLTLDAGWIR